MSMCLVHTWNLLSLDTVIAPFSQHEFVQCIQLLCWKVWQGVAFLSSMRLCLHLCGMNSQILNGDVFDLPSWCCSSPWLIFLIGCQRSTRDPSLIPGKWLHAWVLPSAQGLDYEWIVRRDMVKAMSGFSTTTGQRMLLIAPAYRIPHMHFTCIRVTGDWSIETVAPCIIAITTGTELVSLNLLTITWIYVL